MCVCKKWHSFLKSGVFAKTYHHCHLTNYDHQNHHKHLVFSTTKPYTFRRFDCETPKSGLTAARPLPFDASPENIVILSSLHGLLCVGLSYPLSRHEYSALILWNPLTGDYKTLSKEGSHKECYNTKEGIFGLYYVSSDDDYKLLRVTRHTNIYIYSLKSDSWRKVESTVDFQQNASNWTTPGVYWEQPTHILFNESLYLLKQVERKGVFIRSYSIMRFDTKTEKFTEIAIPSFGNLMTTCLALTVRGGCIHFCVAILIDKENYTHRCCYEMIELWRMDGDGDWTKVLTYGPMSIFLWNRSLLHLMRNGNLLTQHLGYVYVLDMRKHTKNMVFPCESTDKGTRYIIPARGTYIETTVSPNQYI